MTAALSNDLRERVVAARFGISIASTVRWYQRFKQRGNVKPDAIGGDRTSHRAEKHAATILGFVDDQPDITITEIRLRLAAQGG